MRYLVWAGNGLYINTLRLWRYELYWSSSPKKVRNWKVEVFNNTYARTASAIFTTFSSVVKYSKNALPFRSKLLPSSGKTTSHKKQLTQSLCCLSLYLAISFLLSLFFYIWLFGILTCGPKLNFCIHLCCLKFFYDFQIWNLLLDVCFLVFLAYELCWCVFYILCQLRFKINGFAWRKKQFVSKR